LHALNDKIEMRRLLAAHGLSPVRAEAVPNRDEVRSRLAEFGLPAIVKPANSSGSQAVALVRTASDVAAWAAEADRMRCAGPFVIEEFLEGPEFSVETLTVNGRHLAAGITAKRTTGAPHFVEIGHLHPAPLAEADRATIVALAIRLLDLAGYRFGPAHTEVILTADGPRIVESQARLGGDRIPVLVETATGLDLEAAIFETLAGREVTVPAPRGHAAVTFFTLPAGRVVALDGLADIRALSWVIDLRCQIEVGDVLAPTTNSRTRHGHAVVRATGPVQAATRVEAVHSLLRVRIES
jgi:biotin carboxylase